MRKTVIAFVLGAAFGGVSWAGAADLFHFTADETVTLKRVALHLGRLSDERQTRLLEELVAQAPAVEAVDVVEAAVESRPRKSDRLADPFRAPAPGPKAAPGDYDFVE